MENSDPFTVDPSGQSKHDLDSIWLMAKATFASNNNQITIPTVVAEELSGKDLQELKKRFSAHFGNVDTIVFIDDTAKVFRICSVSDVAMSTPPAGAPASLESVSSSTRQPGSAQVDHTKTSAIAPKLRLPRRNARVPRPPNAFILYRKKHHALLKAVQPDLPNNDISIILGKQWKQESEGVKNYFKTMAEIIKVQHAKANPGYQYTPRKPSEKKRRMTARKRARLNAANTDSDSVSISDHEMTDVPDSPENGVSATEPTVVLNFLTDETDNLHAPVTHDQSAESSQYNSLGLVEHDEYSDDMTLKVPSGHKFAEMDYDSLIHSLYKSMKSMERGGLRHEITCSTPDEASYVIRDANTVVDWAGFEADRKLIEDTIAANADESAERLGTETFANAAEHEAFKEEFDQLLWMWE
ncbi:hypothetical protein PV08_07043 [Exophiala spinifera]|uniref:HMG box domain-containing protein n=1 Tax=Exophiala spinifera TaxID=91928 RepID=A0A0D1YH10_9EURO|nr:uncharacterized protein PV08_07043 [Exophiala spinifera]KIW14261.1 hypothetical protein PV08_07043 [Exophiala spinifera]